ncbi:MAG: UDP-glucose 4-epimerase GalE [Fretibacterium sp.]|nr:UDP-glucose 4-epimerase GalE [Fretibacterium sp.]
MAVLICGGAGYIGSHSVKYFLERGEDVVVLDNLLTGHRSAVPESVPFYEADVRDARAMDAVFAAHPIEAVIHFCACSLVGESVEEPLKYFNNNVYGMQVLMESMVRAGVTRLVFSSSAAVYGEPERVPIREEDETVPTNPYGESKLMMERMMRWVGQRHGIRYVSLRYFNVAGAWEDGSIGEDHRNETHLVPIILQVPLKQRSHLTVFGDDYPTPDGSCIRDYVHVKDLADAHLLALNYLRNGGESEIFNLGSGEGYSVKEMLTAARAATGQDIPVRIGPRRVGDPARLVAESQRARRVLGWMPRITRMEDIIASAWNWHRSHPEGYGS